MSTHKEVEGGHGCIKQGAGSAVMGDLINLEADEVVEDSISQQESENQDAAHSSAAAFVSGGIQDACADTCSICLELFCGSDPATMTSCKHGYHLQCILEWAQRSRDCPMCWRRLRFEDPNSQELLEAVEQERASMQALESIQFHHVPAYANYAHFEERLMQHLAQQLARRAALQRRTASMHDGVSSQALGQGSSHNHVTGETRSHEIGRQSLSPGSAEGGRQRTGTSDISSLSESLKSRFLAASSKWKETITRTTLGFRERWRSRSNSAADFGARPQEVSSDVVQQAIRNIAPDSLGKDTDGAASSSSLLPSGVRGESVTKDGTYPPTKCTTDNHLEGVATSVVSCQTSSEAI